MAQSPQRIVLKILPLLVNILNQILKGDRPSGLPGTFLGLVLRVLCPRKPCSLRQTEAAGHPTFRVPIDMVCKTML